MSKKICPKCGSVMKKYEEGVVYETLSEHVTKPNADDLPKKPYWTCECFKGFVGIEDGYYPYDIEEDRLLDIEEWEDEVREALKKRRGRRRPHLPAKPETLGDFMRMCESYKGWRHHHNQFPLNYLQWVLGEVEDKKLKKEIKNSLFGVAISTHKTNIPTDVSKKMFGFSRQRLKELTNFLEDDSEVG